MNEYTREEFNKHRLQFSAKKCVRMHVKTKHSRRTIEECENLEIEEWKEETYEENNKLKKRDVFAGSLPIRTVSDHLYLGDIIQSCGSNQMNCQARAAKGQGIVRDIIHILDGTFFGSHYFEAMKLMRESMLLSMLTHNLEVSFNLKPKDYKILSDVDMQLLRSCLMTGAKSSHCLLLLELGLVSVPFVVRKKRIMYLHHLLTMDPDSLVSQVFHKQVSTTKRGDWVDTVTKDLALFKINL